MYVYHIIVAMMYSSDIINKNAIIYFIGAKLRLWKSEQ